MARGKSIEKVIVESPMFEISEVIAPTFLGAEAAY
jgi:hypothetical protein